MSQSTIVGRSPVGREAVQGVSHPAAGAGAGARAAHGGQPGGGHEAGAEGPVPPAQRCQCRVRSGMSSKIQCVIQRSLQTMEGMQQELDVLGSRRAAMEDEMAVSAVKREAVRGREWNISCKSHSGIAIRAACLSGSQARHPGAGGEGERHSAAGEGEAAVSGAGSVSALQS